MIDLKNLNIILTGATGGIGNSILDKLVSGGANVLASGTNDEKLNLIKEKYQNVKINKFDISKHDEIENFIEKCNEILGNKIDVLINNAGIARDNLSIRMKDEEWNKVIDINLTSTFLLSKNTIKKMLKNKKGKIINITSVVGHTGNIGQANYAASKAGLVGLTKSLAQEVAPRGITVNAVAPGFIETTMTEKLVGSVKEKLLTSIPLRRIGSADEIAHAVHFLATDRASYITGHILHVNGGLYM